MNKISAIIVGSAALVLSGTLAIAGESGAVALQRTMDARSASLAQAEGAFADDMRADAVNPAVGAFIDGSQLSAGFIRGFAQDGQAQLVLGVPTSAGTFSTSFVHYDAGDLDLEFGDGTTKTVSAEQDNVFGLGYAKKTWGQLGLGAHVKFFQTKLAEEMKGNTVALDLGLLKTDLARHINAGLYARNLGSPVKYNSTSDPLPSLIGAAFSFHGDVSSRVQIQLGAGPSYYLHEEKWGGQVGSEVLLSHLFALRAGFQQKASAADDLGSFTLGMGFQWNQFNLDYAFIPDRAVNSETHLITFLYRFSKNTKIQ